MFDNIPKEMDPSIESIIPILLKRAADTNIFISSQADQALVAACQNCSEVKILASLQNIGTTKANPVKVKLAMCYNTLIDKMGTRVKSCRDLDRVV